MYDCREISLKRSVIRRNKESYKILRKKSAISFCIPVKVLIDSVDTYLPIFTDIINSSIRNGTFPEELKSAEVTPLFKKADLFDKVNYRPVSLLSHVSKVYERIIFNQVSTYFEPYISSFHTGFLQKSQHATFSFKNIRTTERSFR